MGAVFGLGHLTEHDINRAAVQRMGDALSRRGRQLSGHEDRSMHLGIRYDGIRHMSAQPFISEKKFWFGFDGRLDNGADLKAAHCLPVNDPNDDIAVIAALYDQEENKSFAFLKGDFALVVYRPQERELYLVRDRIGARPLYYATSGTHIAFASEIKAILASGKFSIQPDFRGLISYLLHSPGDSLDFARTCFSGIQSVPPSHYVKWRQGSVSEIKYWDFDYLGTWKGASIADAAQEFQRLFAESVRRRVRGRQRPAVSVSGGLDSSSIFSQVSALARSDHERPFGISYVSESPDLNESAFLEMLEEKYAAKIHRIPLQTSSAISQTLRDQVEQVEAPFVEYLWETTQSVFRQAQAAGCRTLLTGHFGDQFLFAQAYLTDLFNSGRFATLVKHVREYSRWYHEDISRLAFRRLPREILRSWAPDPVIEAYRSFKRRWPQKGTSHEWLKRPSLDFQPPARFAAKFPTAQATILYAQARSPYHVRCLEWFNKVGQHQGLEVAFPLFDSDLVQFLIEIPGELQNFAGVPRAVLREALRSILPQPIADRRWKADFSESVNRSVQDDIVRISRVLNQGSRLVGLGLAEPKGLSHHVRDCLENLAADQCEAAWDLVDLMGLETWLNLYLSPSKDTSTAGRKDEKGNGFQETTDLLKA